jgi:hypothetical protein
MTEKIAKKRTEYICEKCHYITSNKFDYEKHLLTRKHINIDTSSNKIANVANVANNEKKVYTCECGKEYNHRQSLSVHRKNCKNILNDKLTQLQEKVKELSEDREILVTVLKDNADLKNLLKTLVENGISNVNSHNNINSNNSTTNNFNLNVFLNETCKNAMNLSEFIKGMEMDLHDVEYVGANGYVNGISNILVRNLKKVELEKRPLHCTDQKRETFYIKENDVWAKEDLFLENNKMVQLVRDVSVMNAKNVQIWRDKYPQCLTAYSDKTDQYNYIVHEALGGDTKFTTKQKEEKIISKIAKAVFIDKKSQNDTIA